MIWRQLRLPRRTIVIKAGEIVADGKTMDILTNVELLDRSGLEMPLSLHEYALSAAPKRSRALLRKAVFIKVCLLKSKGRF